MVEKITAVLEAAYPLPADTRVFLREYPLENVGQDGRLSDNPAFVEAVQKLSG